MGKRSVIPTTEEEVAGTPLPELNRHIASLEYRTTSRLSASLRRSAFKTLVWLEAQREAVHGIKAPERKF